MELHIVAGVGSMAGGPQIEREKKEGAGEVVELMGLTVLSNYYRVVLMLIKVLRIISE